MKIYISPRRSGKTTKAVDWLKEKDNRILITFGIQEADRLRELHPNLSKRIMTHREYRDTFFVTEEKKNQEIGIDNLDQVIQSLFDDNVVISYLTCPFIKEEK